MLTVRSMAEDANSWEWRELRLSVMETTAWPGGSCAKAHWRMSLPTSHPEGGSRAIPLTEPRDVLCGSCKSLEFSFQASTEKNIHHESRELSFIWGKMRTAAKETAPQIALRNCSKEARGKDSIYVILVKGVHVIKCIFF